jgi:hypothetical protein
MQLCLEVSSKQKILTKAICRFRTDNWSSQLHPIHIEHIHIIARLLRKAHTHDILQKGIFKAKECPKCNDVELSRVESLLQRVLHLASRSQHKAASAAQNATFWILKIIN